MRRYPAWPSSADLYIAPQLVRQVGRGAYDLVHVQGVNNFLPPPCSRGRPAVGGTDGGNLPYRWSLQPPADNGQGDAVASPAAPAPRDEGVGRGLSLRGRRLRSTAGTRTGEDPAHPQWSRAPPGRRFGTRGLGLTPGVLGGSTRTVQGTPSLIAAMPALLELAPRRPPGRDRSGQF